MTEAKYFPTSLEGAKQYAEMAEKAFDDPPYSFAKTTISKSVITESMQVTVDSGIEAVIVPEEYLSNLSVPEIINRELLSKGIRK